MPFTLKHTDCNGKQRAVLHEILLRKKTAFIDKSGKLGDCDILKHKIYVKVDARPLVKMPCRMNPRVKDVIDQKIEKLLKEGWILTILFNLF